jgi:hypothetical protein
MTSTLEQSSTRPPAATLTGSLFVLAAVGAGLLAVAHAGVELPLVSALGPGGDRPVPVAAAVFGVGTLVYLALAIGAFARAGWVRPVGLLVSVLAILQGVRSFRGVASGAAIVVSVLIAVLLLSPGGRAAFRRRA